MVTRSFFIPVIFSLFPFNILLLNPDSLNFLFFFVFIRCISPDTFRKRMFTLGLMLPSKFPLFFLQDYSLIVPVSDSDLKKLDGCIPSPPVVFFFSPPNSVQWVIQWVVQWVRDQRGGWGWIRFL